MRISIAIAATAAFTLAHAQYSGFNYGSTFTDGSAKQQADFEAEFTRSKNLQGTNGRLTSARLYTMIQADTTDTPISAIPAAINTQTTLLLGLWASAGQDDFINEVIALTSAITQYGTNFTSLVAGISVGSEDLYRNSPTGIQANGYNGGAQPSDIVRYISQVRNAISGTSASAISVGHVDTWTAWVNGSNAEVISSCDWLGMDAYPYFQNTIANSIDVGNSTFYDAYDATQGVAGGRPVWVTETGWPVSGPQQNQAVASTQNAEIYWQQIACSLLGRYNTFWYILQDAEPTTPSPSFGIIGSDLSSAPLFDLTCSNGNVHSQPDTAYGTQYNGTINPTVSTIFNFDLPASYARQTCSLVFLFPEQAALQTSAYTFNGQGGMAVNELSSAVTAQTTYNTVPQVSVSGRGTIISLQPGNSYVMATQACAAGFRVAYEFVSTGGLDLEYFQDDNPSPLGAFITIC
ncbi:glycoside hydrolase family 17 protein [Baudoinia panamericana UAMH 10762]|uniref:Probable glucan endo-1,3-beta-glucosidase eglC n=1 Tax=Baudoinia panamericana (strain UAMH 10762) TaxID=717646 RepID=M2M3N6_BAUPA|nr:glycoside hydrolase family 17 protein [Baudoinia panamericana UAMH 10762]EMC91171.1 glycoside hydrolase family 17 protein [Baudoinia panamericana UAMH 10762]